MSTLLEDVFDKEAFYALFAIDDEITREHQKSEMRQKALSVHKAREFDKLYRLHYADWKADQLKQNPTDINKVRSKLEQDQYGKIFKTRENFIIILDHDPHFKGTLRLNEFTGGREYCKNDETRPYTDTDDAEVRCYIEKTYGLSDCKKLEDAIIMKFDKSKYHPVKKKIESIVWDGQHRIAEMLTKYLGCEDTPYTQEVSRIIFHSAIIRLYNPGCKADYMPVLIGSQGEGKSTFVRMLNICDEWFREVSEFEGQRGMEALEGGWVCEVSELLALKRTKDANAVKAYLTRQADTYRKPYDKYVTVSPRKCIFIGTTNTEQFLNDPTGGRRYLPVKVGKGNIWKDVELFKADVLQCWAEAYADYQAGRASTIEKPELREEIKQHQEAAQEDDWRIGTISDYLVDKRVVCVKQIWDEALHMPYPPTRRDSAEISQLMQQFPEWKKKPYPIKIPKLGSQRVWERVKKSPIFDESNWDEI